MLVVVTRGLVHGAERDALAEISLDRMLERQELGLRPVAAEEREIVGGKFDADMATVWSPTFRAPVLEGRYHCCK